MRGTINHDYAFRTGTTTPDRAGRVAIVGGRVAVSWPGGLMVSRMLRIAPTVVIGAVLIAFGAYALRRAGKPDPFAAADARIVDVDLLDRRMLGRGALWDFAYDAGGRRVTATATVIEDPVITDGVVTRGAAVVTPDGEARLLTVGTARALLPEATQRAIAQAFHAHRPPLDPGFAALAARFEPGPERDYVTAFGRAWHDPDIAEINAAILRRHEAALKLGPQRTEELLRECRRFVVRG